MQYVTWNYGLLETDDGRYSFNVDVVKEKDLNSGRYRIHQAITRDVFDELWMASGWPTNFAFMRYHYGNEVWDREIIITKKWWKKAIDAVTGNDDIFDGLVIEFMKTPDFKKRKRVCGY